MRGHGPYKLLYIWAKNYFFRLLNGNITKETFHFEEVLFYEVILLNWYNNKHDFINVGKGISEKEFKVSKEPQKELSGMLVPSSLFLSKLL